MKTENKKTIESKKETEKDHNLNLNTNINKNPDNNNNNNINENGEDQNYIMEEFRKGFDKKAYIMKLFFHKLFAELYFAWSKDCSESISVENAKFFRDELMMRNNKDLKNFNFRSMRVNKNFLMAFVGNLDSGGGINKIDLADNLVSDVCMHNIKNIISVKKVVHLNLASNMISAEGLKIIQREIMNSDCLRYLNLGVIEGSFRRNNLSGEGGLIIARILLSNESLNHLILEDNDLGEESADKIGSALIQNKIISRLRIADNKIKNKGAKSILENAEKLVSLSLSNNEITPEICLDLKKLIYSSSVLQELNWDSNTLGVKGIKFLMEGLSKSRSLRQLSIKNTNLTAAGVRILAEGLKYHKYLHALDISSNSITYESFIDICDCLENNQITTLKAKNNLLGDDSMEYFAKTVLSPHSSSALTYFDFSSCKIYDQGLIYLLNDLTTNSKMVKIKLRDNYFSHEIDYVVIDFLEKNSSLKHFDLKKNRFSFQCLNKIQKILERNIQLHNNKEPSKLFIEVSRLKYENTKLNEMKECLKYLEDDAEKIKLNRADIRQDYESCKSRCEDQYETIRKKNDKLEVLLNQRKEEYQSKLELLETTQKEHESGIEALSKKISDLKVRRENLEVENSRIKLNTEDLEKDYISRIEKINIKIDDNKKKEVEYNKTVKEFMEEVMKLDKQIKEKEKSG